MKQTFHHDGDADTSSLLPDPEVTAVKPSYSLHYRIRSDVKSVVINPGLVELLQDTIDDIATYVTSKEGPPNVKEILSTDGGALQYGLLLLGLAAFQGRFIVPIDDSFLIRMIYICIARFTLLHRNKKPFKGGSRLIEEFKQTLLTFTQITPM